MHHHAKFRENSSICCVIFQFFNMVAVCHFVFVWGLDHPQRVLGSLSLCKTWLQSMQ